MSFLITSRYQTSGGPKAAERRPSLVLEFQRLEFPDELVERFVDIGFGSVRDRIAVSVDQLVARLVGEEGHDC